MRPTIILFSAVLALSNTLPRALAEEPKPAPGRAYDAVQTAVRGAQPGTFETLGQLTKASQVLGTKVKNPQGEKLGHIQELGVDLQSGRIVLAVLSVGGFLGVGDKLVALPPAALKFDADQELQLQADKASLKASTEFNLSKWEENTRADAIAQVYREYKVTPYFTLSADPARTPDPGAVHIGEIEMASRLIGMNVKNQKEETVGRVDNLLVDLAAGRVVQVVVAAGGFLGIGDELNPVPPETLGHNAGRNALVLNLSKEELGLAPRFTRSEWSKAVEGGYVADVYRHYKVRPYFDTAGVKPPTPLDQGLTESDMETTRSIRSAISKAEGLSITAKNVKIITRDGHVTLRGPVGNADERTTIAQIATRYVKPSNLDNRIEVKQSSVNK